jgi:hypothetical protein
LQTCRHADGLSQLNLCSASDHIRASRASLRVIDRLSLESPSDNSTDLYLAHLQRRTGAIASPSWNSSRTGAWGGPLSCLPVCLSACLPVCLPVCMSACLRSGRAWRLAHALWEMRAYPQSPSSIPHPSAHSPASVYVARGCSQRRGCQHSQSPIIAALRSHLWRFGLWLQVSLNPA